MEKMSKKQKENLGAELRYRAKAIIENALTRCHGLGVKVSCEFAISYGKVLTQEIYDSSFLEYDVDIRRQKARRSRRLAQADVDGFLIPDFKTVERALGHKGVRAASTYIGEKKKK